MACARFFNPAAGLVSRGIVPDGSQVVIELTAPPGALRSLSDHAVSDADPDAPRIHHRVYDRAFEDLDVEPVRGGERLRLLDGEPDELIGVHVSLLLTAGRRP